MIICEPSLHPRKLITPDIIGLCISVFAGGNILFEAEDKLVHRLKNKYLKY